MSVAVILNTHENSPVFQDTLDSILHYLTKDVLVVVDGYSWDQFKDVEIPALKISGLPHGKSFAPFKNEAIGLWEAWKMWGDSKKWYCYLEFDCLIGSGLISEHLKKAEDLDLWMIGNDCRKGHRIPFIESFMKCKPEIFYFLGSYLFFNSKFMKILNDEFFSEFLYFTNFYTEEIICVDEKGNKEPIDISEFIYPTLAVHYGGKINEIACWNEENSNWRGNYDFYPVRFRPDLTLNDPYMNSCIMHPIKKFENPVRQYHRGKRHASVDRVRERM